MQISSQNNIVDLLEFEPGKIKLNGERFQLLNTNAMGTLVRDLVSTLGKERAKGFLIRYGWSCGINDAYAICKRYPDAPISFLIEQGPIIHSLEGIGKAVVTKFIANQTSGTFYREGYWIDSSEAEQYLQHFGRSNEPVCSMMTGFASGFCSSMFGKRILYKEIECVGRGDERCHFIGKTVEEWGEECIDELSYYNEDKIAEELEEANRRIHQQHRLLQQIMNFHKTLNQMVLDGQSRQEIIDEIGHMVDAPVVVEDARLNPLNWYLPKSEQNHDTNLQNYFLGSIKENCSSLSTQLKQIEREKRAVNLAFSEDVSILPRTVSPIIVGQEVMGFLSVIHTDDDNMELKKMIVERATSVLSFDALKEQTALETEYRLKGEFLDELLLEGASVELLRKRARFIGHDFDRPHRFLLINTNIGSSLQTRKDNQQMLTIRKKVVNLVRSVVNTYKQKSIIDDKREGIIVLTDMSRNCNDFDRMIKNIQNRYREILPDLPFSMCISRESRSIEQLRLVFEECQNTQNVMKRIEQNDEIIFVEKITLFDLLYVSTSQDQLKLYAERVLENLLEYDQQHGGSQLIQTLYMFLENKCNHEQTSRDLNVSSSGLKYRMRRLREIGEINLEDPRERFNLQLALNILIANGRIPLPKG